MTYRYSIRDSETGLFFDEQGGIREKPFYWENCEKETVLRIFSSDVNRTATKFGDAAISARAELITEKITYSEVERSDLTSDMFPHATAKGAFARFVRKNRRSAKWATDAFEHHAVRDIRADLTALSLITPNGDAVKSLPQTALVLHPCRMTSRTVIAVTNASDLLFVRSLCKEIDFLSLDPFWEQFEVSFPTFRDLMRLRRL